MPNMTISISPELEAQIQKKAMAEGMSVDAYVERLIREDEDWQEGVSNPLDETDPEFADIREAVMEGMEQAEAGQSRPAKEVFAELRAKHGIPG